MSDILCMYYSRTGNTKKAMEEIAEALGAELAELHDDVDRSGWKGFVRCGLDAVRRTTQPLAPFETQRPLQEYRLVILGYARVGRTVQLCDAGISEGVRRGDPGGCLRSDTQQR